MARDLCGGGRSNVDHHHAEYALEPIVQHKLDLRDTVGQDNAV